MRETMTTNPEIEIIETLPAPAKAALNNAELRAKQDAEEAAKLLSQRSLTVEQ